jgi:hypothetical protein
MSNKSPAVAEVLPIRKPREIRPLPGEISPKNGRTISLEIGENRINQPWAIRLGRRAGGTFLLIDKVRSTPAALDHPANPVTDDQSKAEVVESAKQIVALTGLQTA